ncbi:MAG: hypothetical protein ACI89L_002355 [Phycisphaerales bacterium]|jgi:hypothetical protein
MLRGVAQRTLGGTPLIEPASEEEKTGYLAGFADEFGRPHPADRPLLARLLGIDPGPIPNPAPDPAHALLWALHDPASDPDSLIRPAAPQASPPHPTPPTPLLYDPADSSVAIEWRTLDELTALHALWNLATLRTDPALRARCLNAARWHVAELQPDNATNHPWAIHVFIELAEAEENPSEAAAARFHAETLLHSCQVKLSKADLVSACILLDAANTLDTLDTKSV